MRRIRRRLGDDLPTPVVPFPNQAWIAIESLGRGEIFGAILAPKSAIATKRGDAAFDGNSGAGERNDAAGLLDPEAGLLQHL